MTALHTAAYHGHLDMVQLFLLNKAEINRRDKRGRTSLYFACQGGHTETTRCLLENLKEQDVDTISTAASDGTTPFRKASARGNVDLVRMLLPYSAIEETDSEQQRTALHTAAYNFHKDVVDLLLDSNAKTDAHDISGSTPVGRCIQG